MIHYNTQLPQLVLPEYGRNIYNMVQQCRDIADRNERNKFANTIVRVMSRVITEGDETTADEAADDTTIGRVLWNHLARIANYDLDIDYPFPIIRHNQDIDKPEPIEASQSNFTWRTYGKIIEQMISKACELEDKDQRLRMLEQCANQMKREFVLANPMADNVDNKIIDDMIIYTNGRFADELYSGIYLYDDADLLANDQYDESKLVESKKKKKKKK